ncbi:uncharacterized protein LOC128982725 [Macrosteles quadrilineatus]|uniref:uncharacterized protein LOC128982725 n=1 Tax=Macrosteles quadrilineatus TaxID=74068 RepID=UPI0023E1F582|nr:uncharacterized protein LOC128982725 [Macrosteles quadrilineatus]
MQPTFCFLGLLLMGSVLGAPSEPMAPANVPTADKPPTVDKSPADMSSASAPQPDTADPDVAIRDVEDSLKKLRIKLNDAVSAIVAPAANTAGQFKAAEASVGLNIPEISIKPVEITANKKYAEIIGQFIADLIQVSTIKTIAIVCMMEPVP